MYAKNKIIKTIPSGGEEFLNGIPFNEVRIIEKFSYEGKRSDLVVLNGKSVLIMHNGLRQIILDRNQFKDFVSEMIDLQDKIAEISRQ